jgi:hypothetical protein
MTTTEIITFDELTDKIESVTTGDKFGTSGEFLLTAINDWPTENLKEPKDFLNELKNEVNRPLTFNILKQYADGLKLNVSENPWKKESINSLLEMFDFNRNNAFDNEITLDIIIERLTKHFRVEK